MTIETVESVTQRRLSYQPTKANSVSLRPPKDPVRFLKSITVFKRYVFSEEANLCVVSPK